MTYIPVNTTRYVECIIHDGIRYCENQPLTRDSLIAGIVLILVFIAWCTAMGWAAIEKNSFKLFIVILTAPFIILLLALI